MKDMNLATIMGIVFFVLGIGGFMVPLLSFDSSLYDTEHIMNAAKFNTFTIAVAILIGNSAIGALLFTLGKIQIALESISDK